MSYSESAHKNLLMGVSQQQPQDRLPGQLSTQINMISDPVTGLRRRPGIDYVHVLRLVDLAGQPRPKVYHTDIGSRSVVILVFVHLGELWIFDDQTGLMINQFPNRDYLRAPTAASIQLVTVGDEVFVANTGIKPGKVAAPVGKRPWRFCYFYVPAGQYSKNYTITFTNRLNGNVYSVSYTTPSGSGTNDALKTSTHCIAWELFGAIYGRSQQMLPDGTTPDPSRRGIPADPAYADIRSNTLRKGLDMGYAGIELNENWEVTLSTNSGSGFLRTSGDATIRTPDELPAVLPTTAEYPETTGGVSFMDKLVIGTGTSKNLTYFQWDASKGRWIESAAYQDDTGLKDMPMRIHVDDDGIWRLTDPEYMPRPSGDVESNPDFHFLKKGITGMTTFQGRLVLLSNEYACMSASDNPLRWYRRSVAALADDDPIEVAAQGTLTAPYVYGVTYNKDLVLFSRSYQAVVPGGGILTPRTASLSVTTTYESDMNSTPVAAGRSLYFGAPRSLGYVGIHEMLPSPSTDSQYVADDISSHIPTYIPGPVAFIAGANTSGYMVTGAVGGPPQEITMYQYIWAGNQKAQQAWHKWDLHKEVIGAYFTGDTLMVLLYHNGRIILAKCNLRALTGRLGLPDPRYDLKQTVTCTVAGRLTVQRQYWEMINHQPRAYRVSAGVGQFLERRAISIQHEADDTHILIPEAEVGQVYVVGHGYESLIEPSPPVIRDHNDVPITTTRATLRGYRVGFVDTGEFDYKVGDIVRPGAWLETTPLRLYSRRLNAGEPFVDTAVVPLPARVDLLTSSLQLRADGPYDMNFSSIEYGYKHNIRYRRT